MMSIKGVIKSIKKSVFDCNMDSIEVITESGTFNGFINCNGFNVGDRVFITTSYSLACDEQRVRTITKR